MTTFASSPALASPLQTQSPRVKPRADLSELFKDACSPVTEDLEWVERELVNSLQSKVEGVPEMMAYLINSGGKRIRPLVTCLMARACGHEGCDHIPLACVSELLHSATLYHDDVVDNAKMRRGKPTASSLFGNKVIVLAGDLMLAHSFSVLMEGGYFMISRALSKTVRQMVEGEILQLQCEGCYDTTQEQYLEIINNKTASLFSWCGEAGALISATSVKTQKQMAALGHEIGMAFQLVDDLMDFVGDPEKMGKTPFNDLQEGKITLPLLTVLKHDPDFRTELEKILQSGNGQAKVLFALLKERVQKPEILRENRLLIDRSLTRARNLIETLKPSPYRNSLSTLIDYLALRDH